MLLRYGTVVDEESINRIRDSSRPYIPTTHDLDVREMADEEESERQR